MQRLFLFDGLLAGNSLVFLLRHTTGFHLLLRGFLLIRFWRFVAHSLDRFPTLCRPAMFFSTGRTAP